MHAIFDRDDEVLGHVPEGAGRAHRADGRCGEAGDRCHAHGDEKECEKYLHDRDARVVHRRVIRPREEITSLRSSAPRENVRV